jgi:2-phosphoglycolate phosphatase
MPLPAPSAVLFDLDGTLADTAPDLAAAVNQLRSARGLTLVPLPQLRPYASAGARGLIGAAFGIQPGEDDYEALRVEFIANYVSNIAGETTLFDGIAPLLMSLEARRIPWGIVTNKAARLTDILVPKVGLAHAGCVVSGDSTPYSKPHPEPLFEAARRLGVEPAKCWYVGDDPRDIEAGQAAGMATIAAGWGYCGKSDPVQWGADHVEQTPQMLERLIQASCG